MVGLAAYGLPLRETLLKKHAITNGLVPATETHISVDANMAKAGELLFKSKLLSLSGETSCETCHLDEFGSADGLPNAVGTGGEGKGLARLAHGGDVLPRNTLALWGRGGVGFTTFFWDGKVEKKPDGHIHSQFGDNPPSADALEVAAHLPIVEIREMIPDKLEFSELKQENRTSADSVYRVIEDRVRSDPELIEPLSTAFEIPHQEVRVSHIAGAIAAFIRQKFRLTSTRFHRFVFEDEQLSADEIRGGVIFYGKGGCVTCHNGPYFSDLKFHAIPTPQLGFGKNGFGVDYGRFNVTLDPNDLYKFRTPPLINVAKTKPFGHSGSQEALRSVILSHVDPLSTIDTKRMTRLERVEFYRRQSRWTKSPARALDLADDEIDALVAFLESLSTDDPNIAL